MGDNATAPELQMGIRYELLPEDGSQEPVVRDAVLRRLGSVGVVVQDDRPPRVGDRLTLMFDTPEGPVRVGAQVIVRLRGPGAAPWGFGAQIADIDETLASRLLALRMTAAQPAAATGA
ncbi:MAG: hypothetical protein GYA57_19685 [Myxococcales bacterium]|nr:hypothetical protein [Myxococcales bacterium]